MSLVYRTYMVNAKASEAQKTLDGLATLLDRGWNIYWSGDYEHLFFFILTKDK